MRKRGVFWKKLVSRPCPSQIHRQINIHKDILLVQISLKAPSVVGVRSFAHTGQANHQLEDSDRLLRLLVFASSSICCRTPPRAALGGKRTGPRRAPWGGAIRCFVALEAFQQRQPSDLGYTRNRTTCTEHTLAEKLNLRSTLFSHAAPTLREHSQYRPRIHTSGAHE